MQRFIFLIILSVLNSCGPQSENQLYEFRPIQRSEDGTVYTLENFQLHQLVKHPHILLKAKAQTIEYQWSRDLALPHLDVEFAALTEEEFDVLKNTYGFGQSQVLFREQQTYNLIDFMTPFMQAVTQHFFIQEINGDLRKWMSNCWTTGYEFIRHARESSSETLRNFSVFYVDAEDILEVMPQPQFATLVATVRGSESLPHDELKFGDVIFFYDADHELYHVAVYIDKDILFEKVAFTSEAPYRLTLWQDLYHPVRPNEWLKVYRFHNRNLPAPETVFLSKYQRYDETKKIIVHERIPLNTREISLIRDKEGRVKLDPQSFKALHRRTR